MSDGIDQERNEQPRRKPVARRNFDTYLDEIMARAHADGLMDNLPGQGKPLDLRGDENVPDEMRLGFHMLKSSGFAPVWVEARREIDAERARLVVWLADAQRRFVRMTPAAQAELRKDYRRKLDDIQRLILTFNLQVPPGIPHIEGLRMAEELAKLGT